MDVQVNYWAVLLAAVSTMVVGSIWYAKPVFGRVWMKLAGIDEKKASQGAAKALSLTFLLSLLTAYVLAHVTYLAHSFFGNSFFQDAVSTAFWVWLGFVLTRLTTHALFEQRPTKLNLLAVGNELVTIMVMGVVIGLLQP
jgi:hypothetical protein